MKQDIIEHPELDKVYLCRRNKGGSEAKRFEPARVVDVDVLDFNIKIVHLEWLYDGMRTDYQMYHGFMKILDDAWLRVELSRQRADLEKAARSLDVLKTLKP